MSKIAQLVSILFALVFGISACNLPSNATPTPTQGAESVLTAAAQTVEANLTQAAILNPPTLPVIPTSTTAPPTVTLAAASATNAPPAATATQDCDNGDFVTDVTIPDGTALAPDEAFTKTWRLKNVGTCSWTPSYTVVFSNGDSMSGPATQAMVGNVNPGQTVDISVNLKAPSTAGDYKGYWKLRNASGVLFATFYVDIKVSGSGPFAVTGVSFTTTTWGDASHTDCPKVVADITTNAAGTVTYKWTRSDSASTPTKSLVFGSAGTQSDSYEWALGSGAPAGTYWLGIYIDDPNHQDFGHVNVTKCTVP